MSKKPSYQELEQRIAELERDFNDHRQKRFEPSPNNYPYAADSGGYLLSSIIDNTKNVIYVKDLDGRFLLVNTSFCDIFGFRKDDVIGKTPFELFPHDIAVQHLENDKRIIASTSSMTFNEQAVLADGLHDYISVKFPIVDDTGAIIAIGGISTDITQIKLAQEALRQSEEMNRLLLEQADAIVWTVDRKFRFTSSRGAGLAKLGLQQSQVVGQHLQDFFGKDDKSAPALQAVRKALGGQSVSFEEVRGGILWMCRIEPLRDPEGNIVGSVAVSLDISERHRSEALLLASELKFKNIIDASPMGIHLYQLLQDDRLIFIGANPASDRLLGVKHEQFIGKSIEEAFPGLENTEVPTRYREAAKKGRMWRTEHIQYDEGMIRGAFEVVAFQTEAGKMAALFNEITARKQVEAALREGEKRYKDLVAMLPVAVFETDSDIQLTFANSHAFKIFGYSEADLEKGIYGLDLIAPTDQEKALANIATRMKGENPGMVEYQAITKDGATFPVLLQATTISKDDQFQGIRGIIVDISDRKRQEEENQKIKDQLRQVQKMDSIGRLAGGVAHDLNNMLSPIIGYSELLMQDLDPNDNRSASVSQILGAGCRARDLVHQLLAFSRKQTLEYKPANLCKVVTNFEMLLRRTIREDVEIDIITSSIEPVIMADVGQIEQVIMNLAVNAQDAMPDGGKLIIEIGTAELTADDVKNHPDTKPGHYAVLIVRDNGIGMTEQAREYIFEPFFSTKGEKGTGLGLAIIYGIVKQHEGNIWVYSEKGMGSTFKIYLPMPEKPTFHIDPDSKTADDLKGSETIIVAEDDKYVRDLARDILERKGYKLLLAESGTEALKLLKEYGQPIHLLLTDVVMPEMNGKELYDKATAIHPTLKVLFMSGYTDDIISHHGVLEHGVPFIQKPFTSNTLALKVREILDK